MANQTYAYIKDNVVVNIAIFDNPEQELLNFFIQENNLDDIVLANEKTAINGTYEDGYFYPISPYPSWIKDTENKDWMAPIPYPSDGKNYYWNEENTCWTLYEEPVILNDDI